MRRFVSRGRRGLVVGVAVTLLAACSSVSAGGRARALVFEPTNDTESAVANLRVNDPSLEGRFRFAPLKRGGLRLPAGMVAAAFTQTAAILTDAQERTIQAVSLEDGSLLWKRQLSGSSRFGRLGTFNDRVYTQSGVVLDVQTGKDARLQEGFDTPRGISAINQSLDGQTLFVSYLPEKPLPGGESKVQNVVLKAGASRPLVRFASPSASFSRLPGGGINFSGLIYDPRTAQAVRMPADSEHLFVATSDGVVEVDPVITATTTFPLRVLPWVSSPTSLADSSQITRVEAPRVESGSSTRGRCTVNQIRPLPSLSIFNDFCGEGAPLPAVKEPADIDLWGGISGGSGRMWFWQVPGESGEQMFLSTSPLAAWALRFDAFGHVSPDVLWVSRRFGDRVSVTLMDTAGRVRDLFSLPPHKGFQVLGHLGSQRYLCTLPQSLADFGQTPRAAVAVAAEAPSPESVAASSGGDFCVKLGH